MNKFFFSNVGKVVTGDRYVNRIKKEEKIERAVFGAGENYGSISIVGLPRIGKTSLVKNTLIKNEEYIKSNNIICIQYDITRFENPYAFYATLVDDVCQELSDEESKNTKLKKHLDKFTESNYKSIGNDLIFKIFKCIKKELNRRVLIVLDEFDHVKKLFANQTGGINFLRDLATAPETEVTFIVISRRIISELEENLDCSTFAQALSEIFISYYDDSEIIEFKNFLQKHSIKLTENEYQDLIEITGKHPFLIDTMLNYYMIEDNIEENEDEKSFNKLLNKNIKEFYDIFNKLCDIFKEQNLLDKIYQLYFGPKTDCTNEDISKLKSYGVIYFDKSNICTLFSKEFAEYLQLKELTGDFQTIWYKTEKLFRNIIKTKYFEKFNDSWHTEFQKELEKTRTETVNDKEKRVLTNLLDNLKKSHDQKQKNLEKYHFYNEKINDTTIIDFLDTGTLLNLIYFMYNPYSLNKIFERDKYEFIKRSKILQGIRNTYQHNNSDLLDEKEINNTNTFCEELNNQMHKWLKRNKEESERRDI